MSLRRVLVAVVIAVFAVSAWAPTHAAAATASSPTIAWGYGDMHPGDGENLFLTGFDFSQPVTIKFFDRTITTTYYPSARFPLYTPEDAPFGPTVISAEQGNRRAQATVNMVEWTPSASASSANASAGQRITFNAEGFASGDTVRLFVNGRDQERTASAGSSVNYYYTQGILSAAFGYRIPDKFRGTTVTFTLQSDRTGALSNVSVNVAP